MADASDSSSLLTVIPEESQHKGQALLAWLVIVGLVGFVIWLQMTRSAREEADARGQRSLWLVKMQERYLVGAADLLGSREKFYAQVRALNTGPIDQRLIFVVVAGELAGPKQALEQLQDLRARMQKNHVQPTQMEEDLMTVLRRLYADYGRQRLDAPSLSGEDRQLLQSELGWFGELALVPRGTTDAKARAAVMRPAYQTVIALVSAVVVGGLLGLIGLIALTLFLIYLFSGKLQNGIRCGSSHGGVYAETFALWLFLFLGLAVAADFLPKTDSSLLVRGLLSLTSLVALGWPVVRGIPWQQVRWEVGLKPGKVPILEPLLGLGNYVMMLPLVGVSLLLIFLLMLLQHSLQGGGDPADNFAPPNLPSHPVIREIAEGGWWTQFQVFLLASLFAPLVEETMFRGVLYRHLREASCRLGYFSSVVLSATVAGFVFAAIHPQGLIAIPSLMAIAFGLTLVREWRGTLIPGMVTHGIHNGVLLLIALLMLGN